MAYLTIVLRGGGGSCSSEEVQKLIECHGVERVVLPQVTKG